MPVAPRPSGARGATAALLVVGALALTAACGPARHDAVAAGTSTTTPAPTPTPAPPPPPPALWPLTGVPSGAVPAHPAIAVKIENSSDARPQTGLGSADLVWEEVVEGGITRFVAVFHSAMPEQVGPVRSVRPMDPSITAPLHGILAASGGQGAYLTAVTASGAELLTFDARDPGFARTGPRPAPHNVYATLAELLAQADAGHQAAPPPQFTVAPTAVAASTGTPASVLHLRLSGVAHPRWTWDAATGRWMRAEGTIPATESDGTPIGATNVVVLRVRVVNAGGVDPAGNPIPNTLLSGSGEALVAVNGTVVPATWTKPDDATPVGLTGGDGQPVRLAPGTTWVELVPTGTGDVAVG